MSYGKKDLPRVFASPITKELNNNKRVFTTSSEEFREYKQENVLQKINEIFANPHHVYKSNVHIKTTNDELDTIIVGRTNTNLLTLSGERINISSIVAIERK